MSNEEFLKEISLENEEWRPVIGYEGLYVVSNLGRIVFLQRAVKNGNGVRILHPRLLDIKYIKNGYLYVDLWVNNKRKHLYVHRIIAEAWIDNPKRYTQIDHIDGNRLNNSLENLRWCTYTMNNNNPITTFRQARTKRRDPSQSVEIACIKDGILIKTYLYAAKVSDDGFRPECVRNCLNGWQKRHKGCQWICLSDWENLNTNKSKNS